MLTGLSDKQRAVAATLVIGIALIALPFFAGQFGNAWIRILAFALLYIMLALGLNIVVGYAGLLDLGYVAFYAVGAYMYALLASPHLYEQFEWIRQTFPDGLHSSVWIVVPLSAALAALFGVLLGFPVLRLRGDYLAIVTLGFGEIIRIFLNNLNAPINLTNGPQGISRIDPIQMGGHSLGDDLVIGGLTLPSVQLYYYLFLVLTVIIILVCVRLEDSRVGRAWMAIREDEVAAKAMGINARNIKLLAFAMGASFGGVSGAMFSAFQGFVSPESFVLMESIVIVAMVVLGGMGNIAGVVLGAVLLYAIPEVLRLTAKPIQEFLFGQEYIAPEAIRMLMFGLAMVVMMLYRPHGLLGKKSVSEQIELLNVQGASKSFGGLKALSDVSISIAPCEIYGLIGPNGAGKTTFFNVITGLYQPDAGRFELEGQPYSPQSIHGVVEAGIARTFQNIRLFPEMTVLENVMVGRHCRTQGLHAGVLGAVFRTASFRAMERGIRSQSRDLLAYVGLAERAADIASTLSYGDQRRLEIARALATEPRLLALDEPAAGMNATEKNSLRELLKRIRDDGRTILIIEHDVKLVMGLCNRVTVLDYGKVIAAGTPQAVRQDPAVIEAYLGRAAAQEAQA